MRTNRILQQHATETANRGTLKLKLKCNFQFSTIDLQQNYENYKLYSNLINALKWSAWRLNCLPQASALNCFIDLE